jgi:hypothetical protein
VPLVASGLIYRLGQSRIAQRTVMASPERGFSVSQRVARSFACAAAFLNRSPGPTRVCVVFLA